MFVHRSCCSRQIHKLAQARKLIKQGCEACPTDKKVWKEAVLLAPPQEAKGIVANAIRHLPNSVSMWKLAASLETDISAKKVRARSESRLVVLASDVLCNCFHGWPL